MKKPKGLAGLFVALILLMQVSCILDSDDEDPIKVVPPDQPNLTIKDNVLSTLQIAYVQRNVVWMDQLLDPGFVFHFSQADFKDGNVGVELWDRAAEVAATTNIFDRNFSKPGVDPVSKIELNLTYAEGDDKWQPVTPDDQVTYPDETWYEKTVRYDMVAYSGPIAYTGLNILASFIVRQSEVDGKNVWRIISWRDDTQTLLTQSSDRITRGSSVEDTTWGQVKALYAE